MQTCIFRMSLTIALIFTLNCYGQSDSEPKSSDSVINEADLSRHIQTLASDEFEGRAPSTKGEEKTIQYLQTEFEKLGLQPGNGESFFQEVPMVKITPSPDKELKVWGTGRGASLRHYEDYVAVTRRVVEEVKIENSELVFAGYGIVAPEYNWNDYEGLDVAGKTVVVMVNDPGYAARDSSLFTGLAMTYYGRWTYKYEEAARQGAAGVLVIHETGPAGYPWAVVQGGWTGPQFNMEAADKIFSRCAMEGWITGSAARGLFGQAGMDYDELTAAAAKPGFKAQSFGLAYSLTIKNDFEKSVSNNVLALYPGTDRKDEYIIYTAHWDHFGVKVGAEGDGIYNGARDNATGTAALIEIAKAFASQETKPRRSILFLAVTAEEQGLIGSAYYAANPIYPLNKTVAALNMDALNIFGKMKDITVIGLGNSELDDYVNEIARKQGRYVRPDPEPNKGGFFRSDHFSFAKQGVPSLYTKMGIDHVEKSKEEILAESRHWTSVYYHKPDDEYDPDYWDLSGMVDDIRLMYLIGQKISMEDHYPQWREGTAFKAIRDASMSE